MEHLTRSAGEHGDSGIHTVWISETSRIASFHPVDGYTAQTFATHEFFMKYLCSLQERRFRFQ